MPVPVRTQSRKTHIFLIISDCSKALFLPQEANMAQHCYQDAFFLYFCSFSSGLALFLIGHVPIASQRPRKTFAAVIFALKGQ